MKNFIVLGFAVFLLSACSGSMFSSTGNTGPSTGEVRAIEKSIRDRSDYWMRADHVSAQHMHGPKAQHDLHADIASCVAQTRELVRLGSLPQQSAPKDVPMEKDLRQGWKSPTRTGPNYPEFVPFHDFDGCMRTKGWERANFVKPVVASKAAHNYTTTILGIESGIPAKTRTSARYGAYGDQDDGRGYNN